MEAYVTALLERSEAAAAAMSREAAAPEGDSGTVSAVRQETGTSAAEQLLPRLTELSRENRQARQSASELFRQMPQASEPEEAAPSPAAVWDSREAARARYGGVRGEREYELSEEKEIRFAGSSMAEISRFFERDARRYG